MKMEDMLHIKKAVAQLSAPEQEYYLHRFLAQTYYLQNENPDVSTTDVMEGYLNLYGELLQRNERNQSHKIHTCCTHIHIVFGDIAYGVMKMVLESGGLDEQQKIIVFHEDYAVGPLDLNTVEGRSARSTWYDRHIAEAHELSSEESDMEQIHKNLLDQIASIPLDAKIMIWADDNEVEEIGLRHAVYLLEKLPNPVVRCNPCTKAEELYALDHPGGWCKYRHSGELGRRGMEYALQHTEDFAILNSEYRHQLAVEWSELSSHSSVLRILKKGQIFHVPPDYFDQEILKRLDTVSTQIEDEKKGFCKATRVIGEVYGGSDHFIKDYYYDYRLRELIYNGVLEVQGIPAAMRYYSVRRKF